MAYKSKRRKKPAAFGNSIAVIFGIFFGVFLIVGGGLFVAMRPPAIEADTVIAAAAMDIPTLAAIELSAEDMTIYTEPEDAAALYEEPSEAAYEGEVYSFYEEISYSGNPDEGELYTSLNYANITTITISAAGDTTLGGDSRWAGYHRFMREFQRSGYDHSFFLRNVRDIFYASDLAILNLEGTLTYAEYHMDKEFVFRGPPHFARILSAGAVDVVTIANNHTIDFFDIGYQDTKRALRAEGIVYFGNETNTIIEVNGIKVGLFGFRIWNTYPMQRTRIVAAIEDLQARGAQLIIAYHHWGTENVNTVNYIQRSLGRFTIESGAHLVLGAHPHVIQGIEVYQGRNIVYSLANFSFGGNSNPSDQDTFIFQQTFSFYNGELMDTNDSYIIPVLISSTREYNNFQPTVAEGADAERILRRLRTYSSWIE